MDLGLFISKTTKQIRRFATNRIVNETPNDSIPAFFNNPIEYYRAIL